jgi:ParB family chromosome partitioning protein
LEVIDLPVVSIRASNLNPRKEFDENHLTELSESLREDGQWNPIIVRRVDGFYELIAGECRLRAAKKLGWDRIKCNIVSAEDQKAHVLALKTNLLRKDLNIVEEAEAVASMLVKFDLTQEEVARLIGKKQSWVSRRLSLASRLCPGVKKCLKEGKITACHALTLLNLNSEEQMRICNRIVEEKLSVRDVQKLSRSLMDPQRGNRQVFKGDNSKFVKGYLKRMVREFEGVLGAPVDIDEYSTREGLVCVIRFSTNGKEKLRRRDVMENQFSSFNEAQNYAKSRGGYCSGLLTVQGRKYWICYVDPVVDSQGSMERKNLEGLEVY